ncbi:25686_t:CDS:2, partial [Racocetra persica]
NIIYESKKILDEYDGRQDLKVFRSQGAFEFLQSIIDEYNLVSVTYKEGEGLSSIKEMLEKIEEQKIKYIGKIKKASDIPNIVLLSLRDRENVYPNDFLVKNEIRSASKPAGLPKKLYDRKDKKVIKFEEIALNQSADAEGKYADQHKFEKEAEKIATPIGWVRYKDRYSHDDRLTFRLHEALRGIKERRRGVPLDGIYSILGLLPYGNKVEPKYKPRGKEDAEEALIEVMKAAVNSGCCEPLAWYGPSSKDAGKRGVNIECEPTSIYFDDTSALALHSKRYYIDSKTEDIMGIGGKSILGGTYSGTIIIKGNDDIKKIKI